jgi:hypothetical protein
MKQPKKLTREQKECLTAHHLKATDWMLTEETDFYLKIIHKESGQRRMVDKFTKTTKRGNK